MKKRIGLLFLFALAGGLLFNTLGLRAQTIASLLFIIYLYAIFFVMLRPKHLSRMGIFLMLRVLILAVTKGIYMADSLLGLNNIMLIISFLVSLVLLSTTYTEHRRNIQIIQDIGRLFLRIPQSIKVYYQEFATKYLYRLSFGSRKSLKNKVLKILLGIVIAIPVLIIIYLLLSSADPIFKDIILNNIPNIFSRLKHLPHWINAGNIIGLIIIAILIISVFSQLVTHKQDKEHIAIDSTNTRLNTTTAATILIIINLIYFIFCYVQIKYLFGSSALPAGFTYAQYAVQGFWQLVIINIINIGALLMTTAFVPKSKFIKTLLTIVFACNAIIFISGYERMHLYLSMYGYSYERILSLSFMFLVGVWIIISFVKVFYARFKVSQYYIIAFLAYYLIVNIVNIDTFVVDHNIQRYHLTNKIDMYYLSQSAYYYENLPKIMEMQNATGFYIIQNAILSDNTTKEQYYSGKPTCSLARYATNFSCNKYQKLMNELIATIPIKESTPENK